MLRLAVRRASGQRPRGGECPPFEAIFRFLGRYSYSRDDVDHDPIFELDQARPAAPLPAPGLLTAAPIGPVLIRPPRVPPLSHHNHPESTATIRVRSGAANRSVPCHHMRIREFPRQPARTESVRALPRGRRFKSCQPDTENRRSGVVSESIGRGPCVVLGATTPTCVPTRR